MRISLSKLRGINFKWIRGGKTKKKSHTHKKNDIIKQSKAKQKIDISAHAINNNNNSSSSEEDRERETEKKSGRPKTIKKMLMLVKCCSAYVICIIHSLWQAAYHYSYPKTVKRSIIKSWSQVIRLGYRTHIRSLTHSAKIFRIKKRRKNCNTRIIKENQKMNMNDDCFFRSFPLIRSRCRLEYTFCSRIDMNIYKKKRAEEKNMGTDFFFFLHTLIRMSRCILQRQQDRAKKSRTQWAEKERERSAFMYCMYKVTT